MIAICIPSYNEADNIAPLVTAIDHAATSLNINIVFVNADNNSPDLTAKIFQKVKTHAKKVSLTTYAKGKGNNLKAIIDYITMRDDIGYCMFIDADITSFDAKWLINHADSNDRGYDYVIPNYSRNMQEGNTTNHFIYPLLFNFTDGNAPYQGIAGDFGMSKRFADYLSQQIWPRSSLGYGVDIFMTMHALSSGVRIKEIVLERKIHKPSFDKMFEGSPIHWTRCL
jgi:glycosyltransferase involved in cell wall biosynthesis